MSSVKVSRDVLKGNLVSVFFAVAYNLKLYISGVSKRTDTKEGTQFRVIMEHEENFFFAFALELLEVRTKLTVKLNDHVDVR
jgi:hypothetical protein